MSETDRAEQAKALKDELAKQGNDVAEFVYGTPVEFRAIEYIEELEAEVTRLETGIAEALAMGASGERWWEMHEFLSELSQPTTDTNGAEMCSLPECPYVHPANTAHFRGEHREDL